MVRKFSQVENGHSFCASAPKPDTNHINNYFLKIELLLYNYLVNLS